MRLIVSGPGQRPTWLLVLVDRRREVPSPLVCASSRRRSQRCKRILEDAREAWLYERDDHPAEELQDVLPALA